MLFRRKQPEGLIGRLKVMFWPRRSFSRSARYFTRRVLRVTASPHAVAAGVAAGCFASFTPFMGLHFILSFALAWLLAGNMLAAALGTAVGNPLTFPFIWTTTLWTGRLLIGDSGSVQDDSIGHMLMNLSFAEIWEPLLFPMLVGALVIGTPVSAALYVITRRATWMFREKRRELLLDRARRRAGLLPEEATE